MNRPNKSAALYANPFSKAYWKDAAAEDHVGLAQDHLVIYPHDGGVHDDVDEKVDAEPGPSGAYFFPFIFIEIAGSLIFALFLYRARVTVSGEVW